MRAKFPFLHNILDTLEFKPDHIYQKLSTLNEKELESLEHVLGLEF